MLVSLKIFFATYYIKEKQNSLTYKKCIYNRRLRLLYVVQQAPAKVNG